MLYKFNEPMINPALKPTSTKVTNASSTNKRRRSLATYIKSKHTKDNIESTSELERWTGSDRRSGKERRKVNTINSKRLDARSKQDRRAGKLSIKI